MILIKNVFAVWENIGKFIVLHGFAFYALTLLPEITFGTWIWLLVTYIFSGRNKLPDNDDDEKIFVPGLGITAGAHRLWSHRTYKAKTPLRMMLMMANSMAGQNSIYTWSRDHRTHHKYSETSADPHNAKVV